MKAIPTKYKSCQFRSRLEAKWAVFFDLVHWQWTYEPFDLNGWIPDFLLKGKPDDILVEVKPYTKLKQFNKAIEKINKAVEDTEYQKNEVLLLGCALLESGRGMTGPSIGWLIERFVNDKDWIECAVVNKSVEWGFFHAVDSYADRITGEHDGDHHLHIPEQEEVEELFNLAGNKVQWKAR